MKHSMKGVLVILAIVVSLVAVQGVYAGTITGEIDSYSFKPSIIVIDGTEIYGVNFNYLCNQLDYLPGDIVTVVYEEWVCPNDPTLTIYKATSVSIN